jgi:hypothetical protein
MNHSPEPNPITTTFLALLGTILSLTVATGGLSLWLAGLPSPTARQERLFELSSLLFQSGSGCVFGMLSTKANDVLDDAME